MRTLHLAFSLMHRLGLRVSETCDLRLCDLDLEQGLLFIQGKGKRERKLPVRNGLETMLESYVNEVRRPPANGCDRLLVSFNGTPVMPSTLQKSFRRYADKAGIVDSCHTLRHSFATNAVRAGVSVFVLSTILGHADIQTTMRYVHANDFDDLAAALDLIEANRPGRF